MDSRGIGCVGEDCPMKDRCARFDPDKEFTLTFTKPPYNKYQEEVACNYYAPKKKEDT